MSSTRVITEQEVERLPFRSMVKFAARCAQRTLFIFDIDGTPCPAVVKAAVLAADSYADGNDFSGVKVDDATAAGRQYLAQVWSAVLAAKWAAEAADLASSMFQIRARVAKAATLPGLLCLSTFPLGPLADVAAKAAVDDYEKILAGSDNLGPLWPAGTPSQ